MENRGGVVIPQHWKLYQLDAAASETAAANQQITVCMVELVERVRAAKPPADAERIVAEFRSRVEPLLEWFAHLGADDRPTRELVGSILGALAAETGADPKVVLDAAVLGDTEEELAAWLRGTRIAKAVLRLEARDSRRSRGETLSPACRSDVDHPPVAGVGAGERPGSFRRAKSGPICMKAVSEPCARPEGHLGSCQCAHLALADKLRAGLETLEYEARQNQDFHLRKAARIAERLLQATAMGPADFKREEEERRARWERKRAAHEANPFNHAQLLANLKAALPELKTLLAECSSHWGYEDLLYRLYHHSFKVFWLQDSTKKIVDALQALAPGRELNEDFLLIVHNGTGRSFQWSDNHRWLEVTRPMAEAFFHARFFLEMAVRYGQALEGPVQSLPSGWGAFLYLYDLR